MLAGDSMQAFGDCILIASAFMADIRLCLVAALAMLVHEVPHPTWATSSCCVANAPTTGASQSSKYRWLGQSLRWAGWSVWAGRQADRIFAVFLIIAASSFMYVALADLIP